MPDNITDLLVNELLEAVRSATKELEDKSFYVFSIDNLEDISDSSGFPIAGVIYEGLFPKNNQIIPATGKPSTKAATYGIARFSVVVGDRYNFATPVYGKLDSKPTLTTLLTKIQIKVLGMQPSGVSKRPWRLLYEAPGDTRASGGIMYLQLWEQDIVVQSQTR